MNFAEWHHGYLGGVLIVVGLFMSGCWLVCFTLVGALILLDDIVQHVFDVRTPVKMLFGYAYEWQWVKDVTRWFDGLFGRKY